jgi:hypothetical protein
MDRNQLERAQQDTGDISSLNFCTVCIAKRGQAVINRQPVPVLAQLTLAAGIASFETRGLALRG